MNDIILAFSICFGSNCPDMTSPHWEKYCAQSMMKNTSHMAPMGCGMDMITAQLKCGTGMIWIQETKSVCIRTERRCVWGKDFVGEKVCHDE